MNIFKALYGRKKFKEWEEDQELDFYIAKTIPMVQRFWKEKGGMSLSQRISLLKEIAEMPGPRKSNYFNKRKIGHKCNTICGVCEKNKAFYHHHLVTLKNGGRNKKKNMIPICDQCHNEIHPWLKYRREIDMMEAEYNLTIGRF